MRKLNSNINVDNSNPAYPNGRIKNNTGAGNGTPVNESVYGDIHVNKDKLMDLYGIIANGLPDNETNGYQIIDAIRALASKNDFILPLSNNAGVLSVPIKLGFMLENEQVVCKAGFDLASQTQIKGSDTTTFAFTANGSFKANEYVRLIKTSAGVTLVRLADDVSLDDMILNLSYLKKCTQAEENVGIIDTKGTTPLSNLTAFIKRVNGSDSPTYLAGASQNGLYPNTHFNIVAGLNLPRNIGFFGGLDVGNSSGSLASKGGDCVSATATAGTNISQVVVTLANAMDDTNYLVEMSIQGMSSDPSNDQNITCPIFVPINATQFSFRISEIVAQTQNLRVHFKVTQL